MSGHDRINVLRATGKKGWAKFSTVSALLLCASLVPGVVYGSSISIEYITFSNLMITSPGIIQFQDAWTSKAFAQAQNSLGGLDSEFTPNSGADSTIGATVTYASTSASASMASLSGVASGNVSIPGVPRRHHQPARQPCSTFLRSQRDRLGECHVFR